MSIFYISRIPGAGHTDMPRFPGSQDNTPLKYMLPTAYLEINVAKAFANASHAISDDSHIFNLAASSKNVPQFIFFDTYDIEICN